MVDAVEGITSEQYRAILAESIKTAGQMLINNAELIVGDMNSLIGLTIKIDFDSDKSYIPEMTIKRSHVPNCEQVDKIFNAFYVNEKTDTPNDSFLNKSFNIKADK